MDTNNHFIPQPSDSARILPDHCGSSTPWFVDTRYLSRKKRQHILWIQGNLMHDEYTYYCAPSSQYPSFWYIPSDYYFESTIRISSFSLQAVLLNAIPPEHWLEPGLDITQKKLVWAAMRIHQFAQVYDKNSYVYRELGLLLDCVFDRPIFRLCSWLRLNSRLFQKIEYVLSTTPRNPWSLLDKFSILDAGYMDMNVEYTNQDPEECSLINLTLDQMLQELKKYEKRSRVVELEWPCMLFSGTFSGWLPREQHDRERLGYEMFLWCFKVKQMVRLGFKGGTQSSSIQQLYTLVSKYLRVWCKSIQTVNSILNNTLSRQGLSGDDAISLVSLAECLRFAPGFNLYCFCSTTEYDEPFLLLGVADNISQVLCGSLPLHEHGQV